MANGRAKKWWASVVAWTSFGATCVAVDAQLPANKPDRRPPVPVLAKPATTDELRLWTEQLDSDRFVVREQATENLIAAGPPAIEAIVSRATTGNLETAKRAIHVLRELALAHEQESVENAARAGLEAIAAGRQVAAGREAAATLESLNEIRQRRSIEELERLGAKLTNVNMQFGFQVEHVTTVEIGPEWRGEVSDLRRLKWLYGIQHAKFSGVRITDDWLKTLDGMQNLTMLTLKHTSVTEKGLAAIRNLPRLDSVLIWYSPIGDGAVEHLKTIKQARIVKLYGTKITKAGVDNLEAAWGGATKIDFRRGGFLGVQCQAHPLGCEVIIVQDNSAAKDGGLEASDVILKYGDRRVESFETLTKHISDNAPGDEIQLEIVRNVRLRQQGFVRAADAKLGVAGKPNTLGIEITKVEPGSFAAELELKPGDVITACDESRVFDLPALEAAFAATKAGEQVNLDYVRAPMLVTKKVKLGEWQ